MELYRASHERVRLEAERQELEARLAGISTKLAGLAARQRDLEAYLEREGAKNVSASEVKHGAFVIEY